MIVDVVYTWCGYPKTKYCKANNDILYSIHSVLTNMPWIRNIFIIVDSTFPYKIDSKKVKLISSKSIIPERFFPITWNSNVYECYIQNIRQLSEYFVYFCDDMYVGKPCAKSDFFTKEGLLINRYCKGDPDYALAPISKIGYVSMWQYARKKYGLHYTRIQHNALPCRKSYLAEYAKIYEAEIEQKSINKVRAKDDFNLLRFTTALTTMNGQGMLLVTDDSYDYFCESDEPEKIKSILTLKPQFFCINNSSGMADILSTYYKKTF